MWPDSAAYNEVGWDSRSRVVIKADDASFYLLWPSNMVRLPQGLKDLFTIRIGTNFPFQPEPNERQQIKPENAP